MKQLRRKWLNFRPLTILVLFIFIFTPCSDSFAAKKKKRRATPAGCRAIIFSDVTKGKRLYGKNPNMAVLPASTAKVMTALVVMENLSLDEYITVSARAPNAQPSKIYLRPGERYKVRDLLYAILLNSANDASIVLAEAVAGSEYKFVQMMNRRAKQLGAKSTRFANSNGLPSKRGTQHTTAYDMYLILRQAIKHPFFNEATKLTYKQISSSQGRVISLKSHNKILFNNWRTKIYGKTGYTRAAGTCFIGSYKKGGSTYIIGVFGCHDRWDEIKRVTKRYGGVQM